jgi:beta,beta-carotene 9',10'-dioxygenase
MPDYTLGFASLDTETDVASLPVRGEIPGWLAGTLVRNGPALYDIAGAGHPRPGAARTFRHWFDGQAMLHRFAIADGEVSYANRFLDTEAYRSVRERGRITYGEFATDPCGSIFNRYFSRWRGKLTPNACVNVNLAAERVVALTETPLPIEFDRDTLATIGVVRFGDGHGTGGPTTAHPHVDPTTGDLVNYSLSFSRQSEYRVYRVRDDRYAREPIGRYPTDKPGYLHSFAITEHHVALVVFPLVVNPLSFLLRDRPFIENYRWRPELGTRIVVISLADGQIRGEYRTDAFFAFHHINAFEEDGALVMDISAYDDAEIVNATYLDKLRGAIPTPMPYPTRYRVELESGAVEARRLADQPFELPRINYGRHNGRPYRYAYGASAQDPGGTNFLDQLVKLDTATGQTTVWRDEGCYPGEPVFVPAPSGSAEDDGSEDNGVVLSVVLEAEAARSSLLVLDATTFTELARASVPHVIPFGFHGQFSRERRSP